jgi:hypothetical protein
MMRAHDQTNNFRPEQSDRVFSNEERWYFRVRDGEQIGPFRYRSEAQSSLERFLKELKNKMPD